MTSEDYRISLLLDWCDLDPDERALVDAEDFEDELAADVDRDGGW